MSNTQKHTKPNVPNLSVKREQKELQIHSAERETNVGRNVPNLRFPGFSGEWECKQVKDVAPLQRGFDLPSQSLNEGIYPVVYSNGVMNYHSEYKCEAPGLVTGRSGTIGKLTYIENGKYWPHNTTLWVTDFNNNDSKFIYYFYEHLDLARFSSGSGVPTLNRNDVHAHKACIPSLLEQEKIASFLSLLDTRISIQNKVIEKYESLIKAICSVLFQKERNKKVKISDLGEYFATMNLSKGDLSNEGEECILYGELFTTYGRVISQVKSKTNILQGTTRSSGNDLLFPASTTVDAISLIAPSAIIKEGVILGGDMFGIHISSEYDNQYLSYLLYYCYRDLLAGYAQGSTIIHLHYNDIKNIQVAVHDLPTQKKISHLLRLIEDAKECHMNTIEWYVSQKNYCLQQLFI